MVAKKRASKKTAATKVRAVKRDARKLVTVGPTDACWSSGTFPDVKDCIVRVKPPAIVNDAQIESVVGELKKHAKAVRVLPQEHSEPAIVHDGKKKPEDYKSVRIVVTEMADAVDASRDKAALASLVGTVMDEERL